MFVCIDIHRSKDDNPIQTGIISDDGPGGKSKLTLRGVTPSDSGDYKCVSQTAISKLLYTKTTTRTAHYHLEVCSE